MTRVFYASTLFGALSLAAALDEGVFGGRDERRLLITSNNVAIPELSRSFDRTPAFATIRDRFDDLVHWNDLIAPLHPSRWSPRAGELPMLSRLVTERLGLQDGVRELVLESVAVAPSRTIGSLIRECPVTVYADGLMSYGPTRDDLPAGIGRRAGRLLYLDLVDSLTPLLLREYETTPVPMSGQAFGRVIAGLGRPEVGQDATSPVILGQYLSQLEILEPAEEIALHDEMLDGLVARGHRRIVFRPHPAAAQAHVQPLRRHAAERGVELVVPDDGLPAESWFAAAKPSLVVSCFSTALFSARTLFGLEVATMGTSTVLQRLVPYENSNRIPVTICDAMLPRLQRDGTLQPDALPSDDVAELVRAVGFCMQSNRLFDLRETAVSYLAAHGHERYFKRRRLEAVGLLAPPRRRGQTTTGRRLVSAARRRAVAATERVRRAGAEDVTTVAPPRAR